MMTMKARTAFILMILIATVIPVGALGEWLIVSIPDSESDVWMTEAGNIFAYESSVRILHGEIGIHAFIRFEDVGLTKNDKINYATLYVYAGFDQGEASDPGASVTIYGIDEPDCTPFSYSGRVWSLGRAYTSASVNWNLSSWGYGWHSVNVTDIVKEIVNQYAWVENNSLGFQILGASDSGHEVRTFEDIDHQHHGAYAYLYVQFNDAGERPDGLPDDAVFEETYGEWDIWSVPGEAGPLGYPLEPMEYLYTFRGSDPDEVRYDYFGTAPIVFNTVAEGVNPGVATGHARDLVRMSNGTLYATYSRTPVAESQAYVKRSVDDGVTWINETLISTLAGMSTAYNGDVLIAVDSVDNLHVIWTGRVTTTYAQPQIWYSTFNGSWSTPLRISTVTDMEDYPQSYPSFAVDSNNHLHVEWEGKASGYSTKNQIWYSTFDGDSWSNPIPISVNIAGMSTNTQTFGTIAVDSVDNLHVAWGGCTTEYPEWNYQIWYSTFNGSWSTPLRISTVTDMEDYPQTQNSIAIDSDDNLHVVWQGKAFEYSAFEQLSYAKYDGSWSTPLRISTGTNQISANQISPSIAVDSDDYLHVAWIDQRPASDYQIWYINYTDSWQTPESIHTGENYPPNIRWSMWPQEGPSLNDTFYVVDENNTVIQTWNGDNFTDINDLKDFIDDYVDPEGGDPLDPTPGTQGWTEEGPFTRFKTRLYFLFIGLGCVFVPLWAMAYKKFDAVGYAWCFLIMVLGVGLLWSITGI